MKAQASHMLGKNLKFLRKTKGLSQESLGKALNLKRSNIAVYESKDVEPRLRVILDIARYFDVSIEDLIKVDLSKASIRVTGNVLNDDHVNDSLIDEFVSRSSEISKILDGFKALYNFKVSQYDKKDPKINKLLYDVENFIELIESLLNFNEEIVARMDRNKEN